MPGSGEFDPAAGCIVPPSTRLPAQVTRSTWSTLRMVVHNMFRLYPCSKQPHNAHKVRASLPTTLHDAGQAGGPRTINDNDHDKKPRHYLQTLCSTISSSKATQDGISLNALLHYRLISTYISCQRITHKTVGLPALCWEEEPP